MKNPRYFTAGVPCVWRPGAANSVSWWAAGTSSQKYHGETPISLGRLIDAVDGPPLIAAGDDEGARDAGKRALDDLLERRLPSSRDGRDVDLFPRDEAVDEPTLAERADDDRHAAGGPPVLRGPPGGTAPALGRGSGGTPPAPDAPG